VKPVAVLPSLFTLCNAFCGVLAIAKGADAIMLMNQAPAPPPQELIDHFHKLFAYACGLIFLANVFDALDGRLARMTKMTSEFGAMLDSLADMITFGVAPAFMMKFLYEATLKFEGKEDKPKIVLLMCFLYVACAAIRLARFTAETEDDADSHDFFKGLPSPAAALAVASGILFYIYLCPVAAHEDDAPRWMADHRGGFLTFLLGCMPALALLMVSRVRYVHVVNRFFRGRKPYTYIVQIVLAALVLFLVKEYAIVLLSLGYAIGCPAISLLEKLLKRPLWPKIAPPPPQDPGDAP
jgi:CDP-diacylglycerol--serine O-phosphatidyltransferase